MTRNPAPATTQFHFSPLLPRQSLICFATPHVCFCWPFCINASTWQRVNEYVVHWPARPCISHSPKYLILKSLPDLPRHWEVRWSIRWLITGRARNQAFPLGMTVLLRWGPALGSGKQPRFYSIATVKCIREDARHLQGGEEMINSQNTSVQRHSKTSQLGTADWGTNFTEPSGNR